MKYIESDLYTKILESLPIACVDVLILFEKKCLLLLRHNEPEKNKFWFPGGRILKNEIISIAALRKAKDETNLECTFGSIISVEESIFNNDKSTLFSIHTINICCLVSVSNITNLKIDKLHREYKWVDKLDKTYHPAVNNALKKLNFNY